MADASFGVEAARLEDAAVQRILGVMRSEAFAAAIEALPGYSVRQPGMVKSISEVFGI